LLVYCLGKREGDWPCHHQGTLLTDRFEAEEVLSAIEQRCRCTVRGWRRADLPQQAASGRGKASVGNAAWLIRTRGRGFDRRGVTDLKAPVLTLAEMSFCLSAW
jgi:hypothetical protein